MFSPGTRRKWPQKRDRVQWRVTTIRAERTPGCCPRKSKYQISPIFLTFDVVVPKRNSTSSIWHHRLEVMCEAMRVD
jgi:hypothetical protein